MLSDGMDHPGVETIGSGCGPRDDPQIPCHKCATEERFMVMKHRDDWTLEYLDDGSGEWVAYCPECNVDTGMEQEER